MDRWGYEVLYTFVRFSLYAAGLQLFFFEGRLSKALAMVIMSYAYYGLVITGTHETSHNCFVGSPRLNRWLGYFFADFMSGQSADWWHTRHIKTHHAYTNIMDKDPPLFIYPWMNKYVFFFGVPVFAEAWIIGSSIQYHLKHPGLLRWLLLTVAGFALQAWPFASTLGWPLALIYVYGIRTVFAPLFMHLAVFNHIGLDFPTERDEWVRHQLHTTRNVSWNWFLAGFGGNAFLDTHLEHHVFPHLSNHMLVAVRPVLKDYCQSNAIEYRETSYLGVLKECLDGYQHLMDQANCITEANGLAGAGMLVDSARQPAEPLPTP